MAVWPTYLSYKFEMIWTSHLEVTDVFVHLLSKLRKRKSFNVRYFKFDFLVFLENII